MVWVLLTGGSKCVRNNSQFSTVKTNTYMATYQIGNIRSGSAGNRYLNGIDMLTWLYNNQATKGDETYWQVGDTVDGTYDGKGNIQFTAYKYGRPFMTAWSTDYFTPISNYNMAQPEYNYWIAAHQANNFLPQQFIANNNLQTLQQQAAVSNMMAQEAAANNPAIQQQNAIDYDYALMQNTFDTGAAAPAAGKPASPATSEKSETEEKGMGALQKAAIGTLTVGIILGLAYLRFGKGKK